MTRARFAVLTAAAAWILIGAGGLVTSMGAGLAITDWPLAYGKLIPPWVGGIRYEFAHRVIAAVVALMVGVLAAWTLRAENRLWVKRLAVGAFAAVLLQALLGGLTVLFRLPTAVSIAHAGLAQLFLGSLVVLAAAIRSAKPDAPQTEPHAARPLRRWAFLAAALIFLQIMLGAWVRHTGAGLAVPDFPLSYNRAVPPLTAESLPEINRLRMHDYSLKVLPSIRPVLVHMSHRAGALAVSAAVAGLLIAALRRPAKDRTLICVGAVLAALLAAQIALAAWTIWSRLEVLPTTAHVSVGSAMFAAAVYGAAESRLRSRARKAEA